MFRRHHRGRRRINILFVTFRLLLSVIIFAVLLAGIYSASKHFSGLDPSKLHPQTLILNLLASKDYNSFISTLTSFKLTKEASQKILGKSDQKVNQPSLENLTPKTFQPAKAVFSFMLVTDSHNDNALLNKAFKQAKQSFGNQIKFVIGLGDYTDVGTLGELNNAKKELDSSGLRYFLIVGDHDLWDCRSKAQPPNCNFRKVFGPSYQSFKFDNFYFILLFNSDNYLGVEEQQLMWLSDELQKARGAQGIYVFVHEPLSHPSSDHVMGRVESKLKQQAKGLIRTLKDFGVSKVFAGDIHYFTEYVEPETGLLMVTVGAITSQRNAQAPRFAVVKVFEGGQTEVEDIEIE